MSDVQLVRTGEKVGASEATLLAKLGIKPFSYGLVIQMVRASAFFCLSLSRYLLSAGAALPVRATVFPLSLPGFLLPVSNAHCEVISHRTAMLYTGVPERQHV